MSNDFNVDSIEDVDLKAKVEGLIASQLEGQKESLTNDLTDKISQQFKNDIEQLTTTNTNLKAEKQTGAEKLKGLQDIFGERDPEEVAKMLQNLEADEDMALIREGKIDEYKERIAERANAAGDARVKTERDEKESALKQAESFRNLYHTETIGKDTTTSFLAHGGKNDEKAIEYAQMEASRYWSIADDGKRECRDPITKELIQGANGLITMTEFVQTILRNNSGLLFEGASGTGSKGSGGAAGGKKMKDMTQQEQADYISEHGVDAALKNV